MGVYTVRSSLFELCSIFIGQWPWLQEGSVLMLGILTYEKSWYAFQWVYHFWCHPCMRSGKMAKIISIPKAKNNTNIDNYYPISLLSVISKLLKKRVSMRDIENLESMNPLSNSQWGSHTGNLHYFTHSVSIKQAHMTPNSLLAVRNVRTSMLDVNIHS